MFKKIIAILRLAVPSTGIILSTRESLDMRRDALALGVSQISAGSKTNPGGYSEEEHGAQFSLGDHRSMDEVIRDVASLGYIPSFCTACYRLGRTGETFMSFAKTGEIKNYCAVNAILTFAEYLQDYASVATREMGYRTIDRELARLNDMQKKIAQDGLVKINAGTRDVYI